MVVRKLRVGTHEHSLLLASLITDLAEKDSEAVAGLLFEGELSFEAKVAAMDALAGLGGQYAPLLAYMARESDQEPELQPRVFRALGRTGHPAGTEAIVNGLHSSNWTVRAAAAEAAGRAGITQAADTIGQLLGDEDYWVRYRASEALLRLGPRGIAALREATESENERVRTSAIKMLTEGRVA